MKETRENKFYKREGESKKVWQLVPEFEFEFCETHKDGEGSKRAGRKFFLKKRVFGKNEGKSWERSTIVRLFFFLGKDKLSLGSM